MNHNWIKARICEIMTTSRGEMTYQRIADRFSSDLFDNVINVLTTMYVENHITSVCGVVSFRPPDAVKYTNDFDYMRKIILKFV